jgi:hypothetical protein
VNELIEKSSKKMTTISNGSIVFSHNIFCYDMRIYDLLIDRKFVVPIPT